MNLKYITPPESEGGTAVPDCGTIHKSEIRATLTNLSGVLNLPFDLNDYTVGSTGKRDYSGDIDLVIDQAWWKKTPAEFKEFLEMHFPKDYINRHGDMVHLKYPIVGYDPTQNERKPRTGFVQIDFNFGDVAWEKFYHYSVGDKSEYKGGHRNLAISAVCSATGESLTNDRDSYGRPTAMIRHVYGPKGLRLVRRTSAVDSRSGVWMKKQNDQLLEGPFFDPAEIARRVLVSEEAKPEDLDSFETIFDFVNTNFGMTEKERAWKRMASNFSDWNQGKLFIYPEEINRYLHLDDK